MSAETLALVVLICLAIPVVFYYCCRVATLAMLKSIIEFKCLEKERKDER